MLQRPWARIADPRPVPVDVDAKELSGMGDQEFAELLRDNLLPREPGGPSRARWEALWEVLLDDDDLTDRAYDVLDEFLDAAAEAKGSAAAQPAEVKRVVKFEKNVQAAWKRLERTELPLQEKIRSLIFAVTRHRAKTLDGDHEPTDVDVELWRVLGRLGVDPSRQPKK